MIRRKLAPVLTAAPALAAVLACVTVNVYFPEAAVKDLSKQIEDQVQKEAAKQGDQEAAPAPAPAPSEPGKTETSGKPKGPRAGLIDVLTGTTPVLAQEVVAPEVSSPAIRKLIESRAARVAALGAYKAKGLVGEDNQALVEARDLEKLTDLKARADVQKLVRAENADREALFKEIAAEKKVDLSQLPKIRETYAATLREKARPGDWIQMPDGAWKQK